MLASEHVRDIQGPQRHAGQRQRYEANLDNELMTLHVGIELHFLWLNTDKRQAPHRHLNSDSHTFNLHHWRDLFKVPSFHDPD